MVDVRNDPAPAKEAIELLKPLCESWQQLARGQHTQDAEAGADQQPDTPDEPSPRQVDSASMNLAI
jgi:hypothetical protein